jgi:hypothetical protein
MTEPFRNGTKMKSAFLMRLFFFSMHDSEDR